MSGNGRSAPLAARCATAAFALSASLSVTMPGTGAAVGLFAAFLAARY